MANIVSAHDFIGSGKQFPIKSAVVVSPGDLVALDSNGQIVLADMNTGPQKAWGFAFFPDDLGSGGSRTGVAGLTVKSAIARRGVLNAFSSLTIGGDVFLSGTAGGYTQTAPSANADIYQKVGFAISATEVDVCVTNAPLKLQVAAATSTAALLA